jgi:hypothetical protein
MYDVLLSNIFLIMIIPGTLAKWLAGTHFREKDQIILKNNAVE